MSKIAKKCRSELPEELRNFYDELCNEYKFCTRLETSTAFYAPKVLKRLILAGWRPSGNAIKEWAEA